MDRRPAELPLARSDLNRPALYYKTSRFKNEIFAESVVGLGHLVPVVGDGVVCEELGVSFAPDRSVGSGGKEACVRFAGGGGAVGAGADLQNGFVSPEKARERGVFSASSLFGTGFSLAS